jgi:hypothetical protein
MTGIPDINEGVSLTELLRGVSRSSRSKDKDKDEDEFVKDPAKIEDPSVVKSFASLAESQAEINKKRSQEASFAERVRQGKKEDLVSQLIRGLGELEGEKEKTGQEERLPDRDPGAATFVDNARSSEDVAARFQERAEAASRGRDEREDVVRDTSEFTERFGDARRSAFADRLTTQLDSLDERKESYIAGSRESDAAFTARRNSDVESGFDVQDEVVANTRNLDEARSSGQQNLELAGIRRQGEELERLTSIERALGELVGDRSQSFDEFLEAGQRERRSQITDSFGGSVIERAVENREASTSLRLLDEQEALAVLRNQPNAVVVGSNVVEGVADDGSVTQTRLEEDSALRNPGNDLFFNTESQRNLGNILNGRS